MAKLEHFPNQVIIDLLSGVIDFYLWMGIPVARRWPRPPSLPRSAAVQATWPYFSAAAKTWSQLTPLEQEAFNQLAKRSGYSGRDVQMRASLAGYWPNKPPPSPP